MDFSLIEDIARNLLAIDWTVEVHRIFYISLNKGRVIIRATDNLAPSSYYVMTFIR